MIATGIGFDTHRLVKGRRLILGGISIEHPLGLEGHSDADALCHAMADALLGAVADGDIGVHFPDNDPRWKNADSVDLLERVVARLKARRAKVVHVDATVMAEAPKLAPYRQAMRERLAPALGVSVQHVSVKATTLEGMGALGRREGIAALVVATVETENGRRRTDDGRRTGKDRRRTTEKITERSKRRTSNIQRPTPNVERKISKLQTE